MNCLQELDAVTREDVATMSVERLTELLRELHMEHDLCPSCSVYLLTLTLCSTMKRISGLEADDIAVIVTAALGAAFSDELTIVTTETFPH